jgi:flavorubredoxin
MKTIKLNNHTFWVGKVDDRDVPFHRLTLTKGTTYNSYLIKTEKPTIIDTVDFAFGKEYVDHLAELIDLMDISYIVINHSEPDHSGGLRALASKAKNAVIVCTEPAVYELKEMYKLHDREFKVVKTGDRLDIGGRTLEFYVTPYLHTEETMVTYCIEDKILYSCDIFSTHLANENYFADLTDEDIIEDFKVYYQLIMHPHRLYVQDMIKIINGLDIQVIAPSHGYIFRENAKKYIDLYNEMSRDTGSNKKALVLFSSLTGNTKRVSQEIKSIYDEHLVETTMLDVNTTSIDEIRKAIEDATIIFFGTSSKYADMVGKLEDLLKELKNMNLESKIGVAFGSFGWSGEPIEIVQDYLLQSNIKTLNTSEIIKTTGMIDVKFPIRVRFSLNTDNRHEFDRAINYTIDLVTGL